MFPIHFKLTIGTPEELARVTAFIAGDYTATVAAAPRLEPAAEAEAPGKPNPNDAAIRRPRSAAPTAPSQPTAAAAPSTPAPSDAAPESKTTATEPAAVAPSAPAEAFDYTVLQKAVNERVAKFGKDALLAIATKHGAATFKALDPSKWAAAHADVVALG